MSVLRPPPRTPTLIYTLPLEFAYHLIPGPHPPSLGRLYVADQDGNPLGGYAVCRRGGERGAGTGYDVEDSFDFSLVEEETLLKWRRRMVDEVVDELLAENTGVGVMWDGGDEEMDVEAFELLSEEDEWDEYAFEGLGASNEEDLRRGSLRGRRSGASGPPPLDHFCGQPEEELYRGQEQQRICGMSNNRRAI